MEFASVIAKQYLLSFYGDLLDVTIPPLPTPTKGIPASINLAQVEGFSGPLTGCVHFKKPRLLIVPDRGDTLKKEECGFPVGKTVWHFGLTDAVTMGTFETYRAQEFVGEPARILATDIYCRVENVRYEGGSIRGTVRARVYWREWGVTLVDFSHAQDFSIPLTVACITIFDVGVVKAEICLQEVDLNAHRARICARGSYNFAGLSGAFGESCVGIGW